MIGELFKLVGTMINGATNVMAGTAILASAGIMAAQNNAENKKKEKKFEASRLIPMQTNSRAITGKYKILDIDKGFSVLAGMDDFDEAIDWVTEYRLNGRKVKIQSD